MYGLLSPDGNSPVELDYRGFATFCSMEQMKNSDKLDAPQALADQLERLEGEERLFGTHIQEAIRVLLGQ